MNSLQIGLIGIGAFVVAVLFAWQWWQTRRATKPAKPTKTERTEDAEKADSVAPVAHRDLRSTLLSPSDRDADNSAPPVRVEPTLGVPAQTWPSEPSLAEPTPVTPPAAPAPAAHYELDDEPLPVSQMPTTEPEPAPPEAVTASPSAERPKLVSEWPFDERLHVHASIVSLSGGPFDAAPFVATAGRAAAWVRLFRQSPWESFDPSHVGSAQHLVLALPLASRAGPIDTQDIDAWRFLLTEQATKLGCEAQFFGFRDGPARAAELDSFLAAVDIIPIVYLVKKDGGHWTGTRLRGTLEANGFRLQSDGRFAYHEIESDAVIFYAVDGFERPFTPERLRTENITALRCMLEPVRLAQPLHRFDMFRQSLRALSKLLDAELKTSEGEPLGEPEFSAMRDEVKTAMEALAGAGIEPGSDTARSLFS